MKVIFYLFFILLKETYQTDDLADRAADHLKNEVPYKVLKQYMDFEGYDEKDWDADWQGIVQSFLHEGSGKKSELLIQKLTKSQTLSGEDKEYMLRFLQLKYAVLFLQTEKAFGKYCFYGCWCLPRGAMEIGVGHGIPVDPVDEACRDYSTCYNCLYSQSLGRACAEEDRGNYRMTGQQNPITGEKLLLCMDPIDSCLRMRCECDLELAMKFSELENEWDPQYHRRWGDSPFDANTCRNNHRAPVVSHQLASNDPVQHTAYNDRVGFEDNSKDFASIKDGQVFYGNQEIQVGLGETEKSEKSEKSTNVQSLTHGEIVGCCGRAPKIHYFRRGQKCCSDGQITDLNAPCNIDFL